MLMSRTSSAFSLPFCSYKVERKKESTARVVVWRQLGVKRSYTLEASFCGCDQGELDVSKIERTYNYYLKISNTCPSN